MLKPDIVYFGESVAKRLWTRHIHWSKSPAPRWWLAPSLTVFSGYRSVQHAAARRIPIGIINRGPTAATIWPP